MKPQTKEQAENWQWLQKAIDDPKYPGRQILVGIHFTKEEQHATDRKRLHIVKDTYYGEEQTVFLNNGKKLNKTPKDYQAVKLDGKYPKIEYVLPKDNPLETIILNRQSLEDAVSMPCDYIQLEFRGNTKPFVIRDFELEENKVGERYMAIVMPLHIGRR